MSAQNSSTLGISQAIGMILLISLALNACSSQPTTDLPSTPPTSASPTQLLPALVLPSATPIPSTSTPEPPILVTSMDEVLGKWLSRCGGGPCTIEIRTDGTYSMRYVKPTEGQGITQIDRGKIAFADGNFHLKSTSGFCETMPNGFYRAYLTYLEGQQYLRFDGVKVDECADRQHSISREMKSYNE